MAKKAKRKDDRQPTLPFGNEEIATAPEASSDPPSAVQPKLLRSNRPKRKSEENDQEQGDIVLLPSKRCSSSNPIRSGTSIPLPKASSAPSSSSLKTLKAGKGPNSPQSETDGKRNHSAAKQAGITHIGFPRKLLNLLHNLLCQISRTTGRKIRPFDLFHDYPDIFEAYAFIAECAADNEGFFIEIRLAKLGKRAKRTINISNAALNFPENGQDYQI